MIETIALWMGYGLLAAGGIALVAFALGLAMDALCRKLQAALSMRELSQAIRDYKFKKDGLG